MIRVMLVEDEVSYREALAGMFEREQDFTLVGLAESLSEARRMLEDVDVAVIDLELPDGDGAELVRELHDANRGVVTLVLTGSKDSGTRARAVAAGAAAVLHKSSRVREIVDAVRRVRAGEVLFSQRELQEMLNMATRQQEQQRAIEQVVGQLTPRELELLRTLPEASTDKQLARKLGISEKTVHSHMENLLDKLKVSSRLDAVMFAIRHGIIKLD